MVRPANADYDVTSADPRQSGRGAWEHAHHQRAACRGKPPAGALRRRDRDHFDTQEGLGRPDSASLAESGDQRPDAGDRDRESDVLGRRVLPTCVVAAAVFMPMT